MYFSAEGASLFRDDEPTWHNLDMGFGRSRRVSHHAHPSKKRTKSSRVLPFSSMPKRATIGKLSGFGAKVLSVIKKEEKAKKVERFYAVLPGSLTSEFGATGKTSLVPLGITYDYPFICNAHTCYDTSTAAWNFMPQAPNFGAAGGAPSNLQSSVAIAGKKWSWPAYTQIIEIRYCMPAAAASAWPLNANLANSAGQVTTAAIIDGAAAGTGGLLYLQYWRVIVFSWKGDTQPILADILDSANTLVVNAAATSRFLLMSLPVKEIRREPSLFSEAEEEVTDYVTAYHFDSGLIHLRSPIVDIDESSKLMSIPIPAHTCRTDRDRTQDRSRIFIAVFNSAVFDTVSHYNSPCLTVRRNILPCLSIL